MNCIRYFALLFFLTICGNQTSFGQEFNASNINPFGIDIDTTGGMDIYFCDFVDIDNDGDLDILYPYFNETFKFAFQENIGSRINPIFNSIKKLQLQFDAEPGFFFPDFADMNNDGLVDIISFGTLNDSTGFNCTYYENLGNNIFESRPGPEIGLPGIGYALGIPEIVDLNQDGDKDIILSGVLIETFTDETDAMFYYGQNSNVSDPSFAAWFIEPYSFAFTDTFQAAFIKTGDLDLDGDLDLFMTVAITDEDNRYMYQENISPPGERNDFSGPQLVSPFGLPEESSGLPFLEDLDGDGDLDLLLFDDLTIFYYENTACVNTNSNLSVSLCRETSYSLNDESYTTSGTYIQFLTNADGCDSTLTLFIEFNEDVESNFAVNICEGNSYNWNGEDFTIAGSYERFLEASNGCDSVVILILDITSEINTSFDDSFCEGTEYEWNAQIYSAAGSYEQMFTSQAGCDSVVTLVLNGNPQLNTSFEGSFCKGSEYGWNAQTYTEAGIYEQIFIAQTGCDSIVTLGLNELTVDYQISLLENTLTVEGENVGISWINCDSNTEIEGETLTEYTPGETGNYAAIISQDDCEVMSECFNVTITAVKEAGLKEIYIYPNPANSLITIFGAEDLGYDANVKIFNFEGKRVHASISGIQVDISDLPSGFYYMTLNYEEQLLRMPFVIVR